MSDLAKRIEARLADGEWFLGHDEVRDLIAEVARLQARVDVLTDTVTRRDEQIARVRAIHQRLEYMEGPCCRECVDACEEPVDWPCPTIAALDGEPAESEAKK